MSNSVLYYPVGPTKMFFSEVTFMKLDLKVTNLILFTHHAVQSVNGSIVLFLTPIYPILLSCLTSEL